MYINKSPGREKGKNKHTGYTIHLPSIVFLIKATHSNFGIGGSVAGATPVQPSPLWSIFKIRIQEDDFILDDLT